MTGVSLFGQKCNVIGGGYKTAPFDRLTVLKPGGTAYSARTELLRVNYLIILSTIVF
jgi:hypothetical protein